MLKNILTITYYLVIFRILIEYLITNKMGITLKMNIIL